MSKLLFRRETGENTHKAGSSIVPRVRFDREAPPHAPHWVKVLAIVALVLFLLFMIVRFTLVPYIHSLSGHTGFDGQTSLTSVITYGGHQV